MAMSDENQQRLHDFLLKIEKALERNLVCPFCGEQKQSMGEIVSPGIHDKKLAARVGSALMAQMICDRCGFVSLYDCNKVGLK